MSPQDAKQPDGAGFALSAPDLTWENGTLVSARFGDIYYSRGAGLAEKRHVFMGGCDLPTGWEGRPRFTICELGFGTGLNFLATWDAWRRTPGRDVLHYIAVEGFPLPRAALASCHEAWPEVAALAAALRAIYPHPQPGFHRLFVAPDVMLTLLCGDAAAMLGQLEAVVDAWYLDGFSPDRNPAMWSAPVFRAMARLSKPGARLATYTAAGAVRQGLNAAGFTTEVGEGYGRKCSMLRGWFSGAPEARASNPRAIYPWYAPSAAMPPGHAAIIGSGLAGVHAAGALRRRGWRTTVIDRGAVVAGGASGNPIGIAMPRLTSSAAALDGRFYATAWRFALQSWAEARGTVLHPCGVLQLAFDGADAERQREIAAGGLLPPELARTVSADAAADIAGYALSTGALYFPDGGWLCPRALCEAGVEELEMRLGRPVTGLSRCDAGWDVMSGAETVCTADAVVLANGRDAASLSQSAGLPLGARRGQITLAPAGSISEKLRTVLTYGGYVTPAENGHHCIGATFDWVKTGDTGDDLRAADHVRNLADLHRVLPGFLAQPTDLTGRAAVRCTSPDHLPITGPLADAAAYARDYATLHHGRHWERYPDAAYHPGLYVMTALGAHGLVTAPLAAEILASHIAGDPWPLERDLIAALHPGRFLVRQLKRQK